MFGLIKSKNPYEQASGQVYAAVFYHARSPVFYTGYGVEDTIDGRFELLVLHMFLVISRLRVLEGDGGDFAQSLFDVTFANLDQSLRQVGIGDMGVPKRMRRMMKAFNGRMHAYEAALKSAKEGAAWERAWSAPLKRNLYGTCEAVCDEDLNRMLAYIKESTLALSVIDMDGFLEGALCFPEPKIKEEEGVS